MATEVLLMNDVKHLGLAGDIVQVKEGYARNFLIPTGAAEPVSQNALRKLEKLRKEREELARIRTAEAKEKAAKLEGLAITISARAIDEENLYGSVSATDIVDALAAQSIAIDRAQVQIEEAFKTLGEFDVVIALTTGVAATIKLAIVAE